MCAQRRLRSAVASAQSDQSFRCVLCKQLKYTVIFMRTTKIPIRLCGCPLNLRCHFLCFVVLRLSFKMRLSTELCPRGTWLNNDTKICANCKPGTYKATISSRDQCEPCDEFHSSDKGATSKSSCYCKYKECEQFIVIK